MAYQPTLADVEALHKQTGSSVGKSFQPTLADIPGRQAETASPQETTLTGKLKNALLGIMDMPQHLWDTGVGSAEEFYQHPEEAAKNVLQGADAVAENYIAPQLKAGMKEAVSTPGSAVYNPLLNMLLDKAKLSTYQPQNPNADTTHLGELLASAFPMTKVGAGVEGLVRGGAEMLPEFFGKKLGTALTAAAASGAATAPLAGVDPVTGAATGALFPAGHNLLSSGVRRAIGTNVTPEQFQAARALVPEGIKAPIGELAQSPAMQRAYKLPLVLFGSGAARPYEQLHEFLKTKQAELSSPTGLPVADANQHVFNQMANKYETAKSNTNQAYQLLAKAADEPQISQIPETIPAIDETGVSPAGGKLIQNEDGTTSVIPFTELPEFGKQTLQPSTEAQPKANFDKSALNNVLDEKIDELKEKTRSQAGQELYGPTLKLLQNYRELDFPTFKSAINEMPVINDKLAEAARADDRPLLKDLTRVKQGFEQSISESAKGDPQLEKLYKAAKAARVHQGKFEKINKFDISPFYKTYVKNGDTGDFINQYLKPSKDLKDKSGLLKQLTQHLDEGSKKVIADSYLSSPKLSQFMKKLGNLNQKQRELLLGSHASDAEHLLNLQEALPESVGAAFEPKTGALGGRGTQFSGAALSALYALMHGEPTQAAVMFGAVPALGQSLQRTLRSDTLKNVYQRALENKTAAPKTNLMSALRSLAIQGGQQWQ